MVALTTLRTLAELEREMSEAGRLTEEEALREAVQTLGRSSELLTTGEAASRLGVSIPTIKRWIERGTLAGGHMGGRWLVSPASVEELLRLRAALLEMDREGNPTQEEIQKLYGRR